ncbi:MAG: hypothetical protein MUE51_12540 [Thermoleophilia bacterium]|jgi:hypothetical protein|nr:hypothetical protein [Thermoleophilia bacterium]
MRSVPQAAHGLPAQTEDPVLCAGCGSLFGHGADADTVCPYCDGHLHPLPAARRVLRGDAGRPGDAP